MCVCVCSDGQSPPPVPPRGSPLRSHPETVPSGPTPWQSRLVQPRGPVLSTLNDQFRSYLHLSVIIAIITIWYYFDHDLRSSLFISLSNPHYTHGHHRTGWLKELLFCFFLFLPHILPSFPSSSAPSSLSSSSFSTSLQDLLCILLLLFEHKYLPCSDKLQLKLNFDIQS